MTKIESYYNKLKKYSDSVITKISDQLNDNNIKYSIKSNGTEIIIPTSSQTEENNIKKILFENNICNDKIELMSLIDILIVNNNMYIRQKIK